MKTYNHSKLGDLSLQEYQYIFKLRSKELGIREIGRKVGRHHSTVLRVLRRGASKNPFLLSRTPLEKARDAYDKSRSNRQNKKKRERLKTSILRLYVEEKLKKYWSPEIISKKAKIDKIGSISHEAIYQWIYKEKRDLIEYLFLAKNKKRQSRSKKTNKRYLKQSAAEKRSIEARSKKVDTRSRFGDWEGDTVVSRANKQCVFTLRERKSRYVIFKKLKDCTSRALQQA
jgi:IS30 family transposase